METKKGILWLFDTKVTFLNITELFFEHGVRIFNDQDKGRTFLDVSGALMSSAFKIKVTLLKIWLYFFEDFGGLLMIDRTFQDHPFKNKNRGNKSKTTFFTFLTLLFKRSR